MTFKTKNHKETAMKNKFISRIAAGLACLFVSSVILPIAACVHDDGDTPEEGAYNITVSSLGGKGLGDVTVNIFKGNDLVASRQTNTDGSAAFADLEKDNYTVSFGNLPTGYYTTGEYKLTPNEAEFNFGVGSQVIVGEEVPANKIYQVGDVIYDFSIKTTNVGANGEAVDGPTVSLSNYLNTGDKTFVILNFWNSTCGWCEREFPIMQTVYERFIDDSAIIALDPPKATAGRDPVDNETHVASWKANYNLTFDMALDVDNKISDHFTIPGYPVSVFIDRYGVICHIEVGAITSELDWQHEFEYYTSENYSQSFVADSDGPSEGFIPDMPADFGKVMPSTSEINNVLSPNLNVLYEAYGNESIWPWEIDGDCIVPSNRMENNRYHKYTFAIMTASLNLNTNQVLTFDYRCDSHSSDIFQVAVVKDEGLGKTVLTDSGIQSEFTTAKVYVALEPGRYQIVFSYMKDYNNDDGKDCVFVKNLRLLDGYTDDTPLTVSYYATRNYDAMSLSYTTTEEVYLAEDGYYHLKNRVNSDGTHPYLLADFHSITPYDRYNTLYNNYVSDNNAVFNGVDYNRQISMYSTLASNSQTGLTPVTEELKEILDALARHQLKQYYEEDAWIGFCSFEITYGNAKSMENPIAGLAPFSAYEAVEYDGTEATVNKLYYDRFIRPSGKLYKFIPKTSGVYEFRSVITLEQASDPSNPLSAEASLYDEACLAETGNHNTSRPVRECGQDFFRREGGEYNFYIYHYLEAGKTYYLCVSPSQIDQVGVTIPFTITRLGDEYKTLNIAAAGFYIAPEDSGKIYLPLYCNPVLENDGYWYTDKGEEIYADFTKISRMFENYSVETMLKGYFYNEVRVVVDGNGEPVLDSQGNYQLRNYFIYSATPLTENPLDAKPGAPKRTRSFGFAKKYEDSSLDFDDTAAWLYYYENKMDTDPNSLTYGMVKVDDELRELICRFYFSNTEKWDDNEWLKACYFVETISANS